VRINMGPATSVPVGVSVTQAMTASAGPSAPWSNVKISVAPNSEAAGESALSLHLKKVMGELSAPAAGGKFRAVEGVEQISVMIWEESGVHGYLVVGGSLSAEESKAEAVKIQRYMDSQRSVATRFKDKFFGALKVKIDSLPVWAELRSNLVQRYVAGTGEMLTCFIPEMQPLPVMKPSQADRQRLEVRTADIPTEVGLPCPIYIHLKQNDRFVCLIKPEGHLSVTQQERLIKMGAENLHIANEDAHNFNLFYVRQKLNVA
jgi:hypothetical protein